TAFSFSRNHAEPTQRPIGRLRVVSGVLHIVPDTEDNRHEIITDLLPIVYNMLHSSELYPPVTILIIADPTVLKIFEGILPSPRRSDKRHGFIMFLRFKHQAVSHGNVIGFFQT